MSEQKVVLVTGASSGIGEAAALEYSKLGFKVAITGRNIDRINNVIDALIQASPSKSKEDFLGIQADFEDASQVELVVPQTLAKFNRLDILVNNAGFPGQRCSLENADFFQDFKNVLQVNLMAATRIAQLVAPHLVKSKGVIINVSSVADRVGMPNISYSVSKAGLSMLTKTLANALDNTGVRVITVSPGPIKTNFSTQTDSYSSMTGLHRVGTAKEVADTIVFLTSDKASFIHGTTIDVDGGAFEKHAIGSAFPQFRTLLK